MMKQALGVPTLNHTVRMDTILHVMASPQRPMVTTRMDELVGPVGGAAGVNVIVAIMSYTGRTRRTRSSSTGGARPRHVHERQVPDLPRRGAPERRRGRRALQKRWKVRARRRAARRQLLALEDSGTVAVGARLKPNDVIIAKTVTTTELGEGARKSVERDSSTVARDAGIVDAVLHVTNEDGTRIAKVKVRNTRRPIVGDKLSRAWDRRASWAPSCRRRTCRTRRTASCRTSSSTPTLIPSRMTIGQLTECLLAILGTHTGEPGDGTLFRGTSLEHMCEELARHGYDRHGRTQLYNGFTGERSTRPSSWDPPTTSAFATWRPTRTTGARADRCTCSRVSRPRAARATAVFASAKWSETADVSACKS